MSRIFLSPPHMGDDERDLLLEAFDSNWIAPLGPHVDAFEREMAETVGAEHAVALSTGTAGLHLALRVLDVGLGDEVVVPSQTFAASAFAVAHVGARPVFVDSEESSWTLSSGLLKETLWERARTGQLPKAVIAVDLYGQCADYEPIMALCDELAIPVVEDAAQALGATYRGAPAGSLASIGVFSFNGNKIITTSSGGMLVSDNEQWVGHAKHLANQARDPAPHYEHSEIGYNYRLSNLLAALGRGQLRQLPDRIQRRQSVNRHYRRELGDLPGLEFMPRADYGQPNSWLTCIMVDPEEFGASSDDLRLHLEHHDIETRPTWKPLHQQPVFAGCDVIGGGVAERVFEQGLCLPSGSNLTVPDLVRIVDLVRSLAR